MDLFGELFLAQLVQCEELLGELDVVDEATTGKLDTHDDLTIGHHHGDCSEVDFQVLGQLLTTSVAGVHCQEDTEFRVHVDAVAVREDELLLALLFAAEDNIDLLGSD